METFWIGNDDGDFCFKTIGLTLVLKGIRSTWEKYKTKGEINTKIQLN